MIYTVIANKKSYDLPKKTISVMESLDKTVLIDTVKNLSLRDKFSQLLNFLIEVLGEANIKEILGVPAKVEGNMVSFSNVNADSIAVIRLNQEL